MKDLYDLLGISPLAIPEEIKVAHRKKAMLYHPDRNAAADASTKFAEVQNAYEVLSNPTSRQQYDVTRGTSILPDPFSTAKVVWESFIHTTIGIAP